MREHRQQGIGDEVLQDAAGRVLPILRELRQLRWPALHLAAQELRDRALDRLQADEYSKSRARHPRKPRSTRRAARAALTPLRDCGEIAALNRRPGQVHLGTSGAAALHGNRPRHSVDFWRIELMELVSAASAGDGCAEVEVQDLA